MVLAYPWHRIIFHEKCVAMGAVTRQVRIIIGVAAPALLIVSVPLGVPLVGLARSYQIRIPRSVPSAHRSLSDGRRPLRPSSMMPLVIGSGGLR